MFLEPAVEIVLAAVEWVEGMIAAQLLYGSSLIHWAAPGSKNPGFSSNARILGNGRSGASNAV